MNNNNLTPETTTQLIFRKHSEMKWIAFIEWLESAKEELIEYNKKEIENAHFQGKVDPDEFSSDFYRNKYESWKKGIHIVKACVNKVWYNRLYFNGEMIDNFVSFDEAMQYAEKNYDRATNTIKKN